MLNLFRLFIASLYLFSAGVSAGASTSLTKVGGTKKNPVMSITYQVVDLQEKPIFNGYASIDRGRYYRYKLSPSSFTIRHMNRNRLRGFHLASRLIVKDVFGRIILEKQQIAGLRPKGARARKIKKFDGISIPPNAHSITLTFYRKREGKCGLCDDVRRMIPYAVGVIAH